jgi:hypothetical protein
MRQQDSRTRDRICTALKKPGNAYSTTFEALMSLLADSDKADASDAEEAPLTHQATSVTQTTKNRMETWWKYNLQTECFSHKAIARHVRRCGL